jgi:hypothetical protein
MRGEFDAKPFGSHGAMLPVPAAPPPQPPPKPAIPPPPWAGQEGGLTAALQNMERTSDEPELTALEAMKAASGDGYDPPEWGPPETTQPLARFIPPEPDWREEERLRARALHEEHALDEEQPARHPPPQRWPA